MNEIAKMTHVICKVCNDNCETCDIKCNCYKCAKQLYDAGYRLQEINFATNEEAQTDDIARIIRTSYSLSPCTSDAAKAIYNSGYRKVDENCVMITKVELKEHKRQAVKEFAEKLKMKAFNKDMFND